MAKPSQVRTRIEQRLSEKRFERRLASRAKAKARRRRTHSRAERQRAEPIKGFRPATWRDYRVPDRLDLINNYEETVSFINDVHWRVFNETRPLRLVFEKTRAIRPEALLLLLAEIQRCRLLRGKARLTGAYPDNPSIDNMLRRTGFYDVLGVASRTAEQRSYDTAGRYIKFRSDTRLVSSEAQRLRRDLMGANMAMTIRARKRFFRVITESMINVSQHAYPDPVPPSINGRWWLAGQLDTRSKEFTIVFCDLGVGIPATLPLLYNSELIQSVLSLLPGMPANDGQMIHAAMMLGRTRTHESHRGKGLNDLRSFIDEAGEGALNIFSHQGRYRYDASGRESFQNFENSLDGTLIKWTTSLDKITDLHDDGLDDDSHFDS